MTTEPTREEFLEFLEKGTAPVVHRSLTVEEHAFNDAERTITAYCTTVERDRYGDIIQPSGMRNANYRNNPVVLWAHNYDLPPIAKSLWERPDAKGVRICMQFDSREEAMEIYRLYREGYLNAFSIGFLPITYERLFEDNILTGLNFTEWELIECSAVPVPANPGALQDALSRGIVRSEQVLAALREKQAAATPCKAGGDPELPELEFHRHLAEIRTLVDGCRDALQQFRKLSGLLQELPAPGRPKGIPFDPLRLIEAVAQRELDRRLGKLQ